MTGKKWVVCKNKFPSNLESGLEHYVVWYLHKTTSLETKISWVDKKFPVNQYDVITYENGKKSVPKVPHFHVIVRKIEH